MTANIASAGENPRPQLYATRQHNSTGSKIQTREREQPYDMWNSMLANIKVIRNSLSHGVARPRHETNKGIVVQQRQALQYTFLERHEGLKGWNENWNVYFVDEVEIKCPGGYYESRERASWSISMRQLRRYESQDSSNTGYEIHCKPIPYHSLIHRTLKQMNFIKS